MSVDIGISAPGCCATHSHNFTYNYSPALHEAGLPHWKHLDGAMAGFVGFLLCRVQAELRRDRARYEPLIRGNGTWGTWDTLMESLGALIADLHKHPEGMVSVCG